MIIFSLLVVSYAQVSAQTKYNYPLNKLELEKKNEVIVTTKKAKALDQLKEIKLNIINGNLDYAQFLLLKDDISKDFSKPIKLRYLAMINFIKGDYFKSLDYLKSPDLNTFESNPKMCMLRVLNLLILDKLQDSKIEWAKCRNVALITQKADYLWFQTLFDLKMQSLNKNEVNPFNGLAIDNQQGQTLQTYLKLALYLNKQKLIIPRFQYFSLDTLQDTKLRELIGLNYFKDGNITMAYKLLEDLNTVNAEVFKGNLYLATNKYTLAYAQYKLALQKKNNSQNALERVIPVAWKLKQWPEGINFLAKLQHRPDTYVEKLSLLAAFQTQNLEYKQAYKTLKKILKITNQGHSIEVSQLLSLNALIAGDLFQAENYMIQSCNSKDGFSCWLLYQVSTWNSYDKLLKRKDSIHNESEDLIEKYSSKKYYKPLVGRKFIDQSAIDELDNNTINLLPELK